MYDIGTIVLEKNYGYEGIINKRFQNWAALKDRSEFITFDPDKQSEVDRLIEGDMRDGWLQAQTIKHTEEELREPWYSILCFDGGSAWSPHSRLTVSIQNN